MKKYLIFFFLLIIFKLVKAGDLALICYKNNDEGQYLGSITNFHHNKNQVKHFFQYQKYSYEIFVKRNSLFRGYTYEVSIKDDFELVEKYTEATDFYDIPISINNEIQCRVTD
jgi:hypothetical protein